MLVFALIGSFESSTGCSKHPHWYSSGNVHWMTFPPTTL